MEKQAVNCKGRTLPDVVEPSARRRAPAFIERAGAFWEEHRAAFTTNWRGDFFGGTIAALIAVPYGMALSIAIGLPPVAGLYTSIIGGLISGMLSDAPVVVSGLSATVVPVLAVLVKEHGIGAALAAGVLSGLLMVLIGVLRLGRFFRYLPQSVIAGFTSGLGLIIATSQFKIIFGVKPAPVGFEMGIVDDAWAVLRMFRQFDWHALCLALFVIGLIFVLSARRSKVPASLLAVVIGSFVPYLLGWPLALVGTLPDTFPLPSWSAVNFSDFSALIHPACTLAGLITINQLLTVVVTDRFQEIKGEVRFNRELVAQGLANVACPFFGAPPGVAMLARTIASARAGAVSRWSVIAHSAVLLVFLLPMRNLISQIPVVVLASVTVAVGMQLVEWKRLFTLRQFDRMDAILFLLTFGLVIFSDLIIGVSVGTVLAMLFFVERSAKSACLLPVPAQSDVLQAEMQMYRLTGPLFFASSEQVLKRLFSEATAKTLVLDLTEARPIDSEAADALKRLAERQRGRGGELHLIGLDQDFFAAQQNQQLLATVGSVVPNDRNNFSGSPLHSIPTAASRA